MANKTELKRFVELKKSESIQRLIDEKNEKINKEVDKFFEPYKKDIASIRERLISLSSEFDKFAEKIVKTKQGRVREYYDNPVRSFNNIINSLNIDVLKGSISIASVEKTNDEYKTKIQDCKREYDNLIAVIKSVSAKDGMNILINLGFKVDEVSKKKEQTALITNIDAKKLFIL